MNLDDIIVGNTVLKKALLSYSFKKPIMFVGVLGCGKTTLAHYVARELFQAPEENIRDINCVYFSKKDDMRHEVDELSKTSIFGTKKVLILDEIHGLSKESQQVLLQPLNSLPDNTFVIACTTSIEGVLNTLISRFAQFKVLPLSDQESLELINRACSKETVELSKPIKAILIEKSQGIPRNILIGIEKLRGITDVAEAEYLLDITELTDGKDALELLKHLLSGTSWDKMITVINATFKSATPAAIRVALINLIGGRLLSRFPKEGYLSKIINILHDAEGFPEKALLVSALFECWRVVKDS